MPSFWPVSRISTEVRPYARTRDSRRSNDWSEKAIARNKAIQDGRPEKVLDKIVDNRLEKFYQENCLLKQPFVKDEGTSIESLLKQAIATLGENVVIRRFARWERGEAS